MRSASRLILPLALLLVAVFSWWLSRDQARVMGGQSDQVPDYYAENLVTVEMDEQGKPRQRLIAERMEHFAHDNSMHLQKPHLLLIDPELPPWILRSETGWIAGDRKQAWLRGRVFMDREGEGVNTPYHLVTSELRLTREPDYAETQAPVYLLTNREEVDAIGMQVWFEPEMRIKLLSQVRGRFEQEP